MDRSAMVAAPPPIRPLMRCFTMKSSPRAPALTTGCQHSTGCRSGRCTRVRSLSSASRRGAGRLVHAPRDRLGLLEHRGQVLVGIAPLVRRRGHLAHVAQIDVARPDGAQPRRGSGRVPRGRTTPPATRIRPTPGGWVRIRGVRLSAISLLHLWAHRDFRCLSLGVFFHTLSMVGEQVVLGWFILELTDSALMVGVALGLRNFPLLLVGIPAGVVADRGDRVRLLQLSGVAMAVTAATLGLLVAVRFAGVWPALVLTFVTGCARALHQTARQSYAHDIAGAAGLVHALALVALTSRVGGLFGSLLIGFLIARHGSAVAYLAV